MKVYLPSLFQLQYAFLYTERSLEEAKKITYIGKKWRIIKYFK